MLHYKRTKEKEASIHFQKRWFSFHVIYPAPLASLGWLEFLRNLQESQSNPVNLMTDNFLHHEGDFEGHWPKFEEGFIVLPDIYRGTALKCSSRFMSGRSASFHFVLCFLRIWCFLPLQPNKYFFKSLLLQKESLNPFPLEAIVDP